MGPTATQETQLEFWHDALTLPSLGSFVINWGVNQQMQDLSLPHTLSSFPPFLRQPFKQIFKQKVLSIL